MVAYAEPAAKGGKSATLVTYHAVDKAQCPCYVCYSCSHSCTVAQHIFTQECLHSKGCPTETQKVVCVLVSQNKDRDRLGKEQVVVGRNAIWSAAYKSTCQRSQVLQEERAQAQCQDWVQCQIALNPENVVFLVGEDELIPCGWVWVGLYAQHNVHVQMDWYA